MAPSGPDDLYNEAGPRDGVHVRDFCPDMFDDDTPLRRPTSVRRCYRTGKSAKARSGSPARQGRDALGPHAFEKQMPAWQKQLIKDQNGIIKTLQYGPEPEITLLIMSNESYNIIPALQLLSGADPNVRSFSYCHPATNHMHAQTYTTAFCGYHSISMLLSYLRGSATTPKHHVYAVRIPSIPELQALIEEGWTHGLNARARIETDGVRGTRKYIGTSEAETVLRLLDVPCWFVRLKTYKGALACDALMDHVEAYFAYEAPTNENESPLGKPPIYLQYPGHSVVIIGFETRKQRTAHMKRLGTVDLPHLGELVVFNCSVHAQDSLRKIRDGKMALPTEEAAADIMGKFRVNRYDLLQYAAFELLFLQDPKLFLAE